MIGPKIMPLRRRTAACVAILLFASPGNSLGKDEKIEDSDVRFVILEERGDIVRHGIGQAAAPTTIGAKQALALVTVVETGLGDFYNLLEINGANDWNRNPSLAKLERNLDPKQRGKCFLWKLPIPMGFVFLIECDEQWQLIEIGQFRCFPATDPSAMFDTLPMGNYLVTAMDADGTYKESRKLRIKELRKSIDWPNLPAAEVKADTILRLIEAHKKQEG